MSTLTRPSRRTFLRTTTAAATALWTSAPAILRGQLGDNKLRIAVIGCGGRGADNLESVSGEHIAAICDVNRVTLDKVAAKHPGARKEVDFRKLYDHASDFDAVVVSTAEHTHAFATLPALQLKKHVYCEKPLSYNVSEARIIREAAAKAGVATQMGTQIHAEDNYRRVVELVQSGAIGKMKECHVWVARAWGLQSEADAAANKDIVFVTDRPAKADPIPAGLEWDLWLGPAPARPFNNVYVPGPKWYRWWDFGNGTMSDLGSHWNDLPFWALKLRVPATIEAFGPPPHKEIAPATMRARYEYRAAGDQPDSDVDVVSGRGQAGALDEQDDPAVAERRPLRRRQGHAAVGLREARPAAGGQVQGLHAAAADDPEVAWSSRRVDPRGEDRRADALPLRVLRMADRGQSSRQRRVSRGEEARVGCDEGAGDQRAGSGTVSEARLQDRMETRVGGVRDTG